MPIHESKGSFSFAWTGHQTGESILEMFTSFYEEQTLPAVKERMTKKIKQWTSVAINLVIADNQGNIGYMMGTAIPLRRNWYPNLGCRVLDGTTSAHDWIGFGDFTSLPFHLNSAKGYYMTANNRQFPDTAASDIGATHGTTARSLRLQEIIEAKIASGHKFTVQDMVDMQQDMVDVHGRELAPHISKIAKDVLGDERFKFAEEEREAM